MSLLSLILNIPLGRHGRVVDRIPWARVAFNIANYTLLPFGRVALPREEMPRDLRDTRSNQGVSVIGRGLAATRSYAFCRSLWPGAPCPMSAIAGSARSTIASE